MQKHIGELGGELGGLDMAYSAGHGPAAYVKALKPVNTSGGPEHLVGMRYPQTHTHTYMRLHIYIHMCVRVRCVHTCRGLPYLGRTAAIQ